MIYVMGLEAAKTRPATNAERKEMQRLLHEGMDAGLCGFSIQRLGPNSTQADFDGTPMVTDTMCDDDIFCLAEVLRERDEGIIQLTQATDANPNFPEDLEFKLRLAEVARRPILDNVVPVSQQQPTRSTRSGSSGWSRPTSRACRSTARVPRSAPASPSPSTSGTSTTPARPGVRPPPARSRTRSRKMKDPAIREKLLQGDRDGQHAVRQHAARRRRPAAEAVVQGVTRRPDMQKYVGQVPRPDRRGGGQALHRRHAGPVPR